MTFLILWCSGALPLALFFAGCVLLSLLDALLGVKEKNR